MRAVQSSATANHLNLDVHDREDYEGKLVVWNGCTYLIGEFLGVGAEKVVHKLINQRSRLALHVIKILKKTRPLGLVTETIARLRAEPDFARIIPPIMELEVPGGMVELQPYVRSQEVVDTATQLVDEGYAALERRSDDFQTATECFQKALQINPSHTEAMYGTAWMLSESGQVVEAWCAVAKAVDIEPNIVKYQRSYLRLSCNSQQTSEAIDAFLRAKVLFKDIHDLDDVGAELYLNAGDPEAARDCLEHAILEDDRRQQLTSEVEAAISARSHAIGLMKKAKRSVDAKDWEGAYEILVRAQKGYNRHPDLCMNLAFAAFRRREPELAAGLLLHASTVVSSGFVATCQANAAFSLVAAGHITEAMNFLHLTAIRLSGGNIADIPNNDADLPGLGIWKNEDSIVEERLASAAQLIARGVDEASRQKVPIPDFVLALAEAYRRAASTSA